MINQDKGKNQHRGREDDFQGIAVDKEIIFRSHDKDGRGQDEQMISLQAQVENGQAREEKKEGQEKEMVGGHNGSAQDVERA